MKRRLILLLVVFVVIFFLSFSIGRFYVPVSQVIRILTSRLITLMGFDPLVDTWTKSMEVVIINVRFPRIIAAACVGIALSVSGSVYQGMFNNPMVSPNILGSSAGAGFGAAFGIFIGLNKWGISITAFIFGTASVFLAIFIANRYRKNPTLGLVLSGIMISSIFTAGTSYIKLVADPTDELPAITYWLMGSLSSVRNSDLGFLLSIIFVSLLPLFLMRWRLNVITLGNDEAQSLGLNTKQLRLTIIIFSTLMTAACVSVSGIIGWVGLVIPHFARKYVGCNYKHLLPASILMGGGFMVLVDNISRTATTIEIPIGILTAFVGAPFFLYMIFKEGDQ